MKIHIAPNDKGNPPGKLADAEIHFGPDTPILDGTKLIGFAVWERAGRAAHERSVTFPARQYTVNGERRSFALVRPLGDFTDTAKIREAVLAAYIEWETANVKA